MSNIKSTRVRKRENADLMAEVLEEDRPEGPAGDDGLTEKQRAFVVAFTSDPKAAGHAERSCVVAGYSERTAREIGRQLLEKPHVSAAIELQLRETIGTTLTVQSVAYLGRVLNDENAPQKLRAGIALRLAESAGVLERVKVEKAKQTGLTSDKNLLDMSRDELETLVRQGAAVLKAAAALPPAGPVLEGRLLGDGAQDRAQPDEPEAG